MTIFPNLGPKAGIGDILFSQPERFAPILVFAQDVMRRDGGLDHGTRELLAAYVSGLTDCAFCHGVHDATARRFGIDASLLAALLQDVAQADIADALRPVFAFARSLTLAPARVTAAERRAVITAGHSTDVLGDVIAIVALFGFFNRLVEGYGVTPDGDRVTEDAGMLFAHGYMPPQQ